MKKQNTVTFLLIQPLHIYDTAKLLNDIALITKHIPKFYNR